LEVKLLVKALQGDERIIRAFVLELGTKHPNFGRQKKKKNKNKKSSTTPHFTVSSLPCITGS
jgi:hypothetical protein